MCLFAADETIKGFLTGKYTRGGKASGIRGVFIMVVLLLFLWELVVTSLSQRSEDIYCGLANRSDKQLLLRLFIHEGKRKTSALTFS